MQHVVGAIEQKLLQQQQQQDLPLTSLSTEPIDFLDGSINLDMCVDLDGSESSTSLLTLPNFNDPMIPSELELPSTFSLSDLLRSEL